jgi:hypothetical protein
LEIMMQRESPTLDFKSEGEVRAKAESRRTEEAAGLLKAFFAWWTPGPRQWASRLPQSAQPIFGAVQISHRPVRAGK